MSKANHLHRYKRRNIANGGKPYFVFHCTKPACSHYVRVDMAEGKLCECNRCGQPMVLNRETVRLAKPHCTDCIKRKKSDDVANIAEFLSDLKT